LKTTKTLNVMNFANIQIIHNFRKLMKLTKVLNVMNFANIY